MKDLRRKHGNDFQDWIEAWLTKQGWSVHNQKTVSRAIPIGGKVIWTSCRNDILAMDLVAVKPGEKTLFIQATLHGSVKKRRIEAKDVRWDLAHQCVQLWQKKDHGLVKVKEWDGTNYIDIGRIVRRKFYLEVKTEVIPVEK
jgi:hypothetical protein